MLFRSGGLFLIASSVTAGAIPQCVRLASNGLRDHTPTRALAGALAIVALAVLGAWTRVESRVRIFNGGRAVEFVLRERLLAALHRLGPNFYRAMSAGDIMSRATNDLGQVRLLVGFGALNLVNTLLAYAVNIPLMFWRSQRSTTRSGLCLGIALRIARLPMSRRSWNWRDSGGRIRQRLPGC